MPDQQNRFADKVAFVTGAAGGIGGATTLAFARAGASVVVADVDEQANTETALASPTGTTPVRVVDHSSVPPSAAFAPLTEAMSGVFMGQVALGVLGALLITTEYSSRSITTTFAAVPQRGRLPYGPDQLIVRGRPSLSGDGDSPEVRFRLPATMRDRAQARAAAEGKFCRKLARDALARYLAS